MYNPALYMLFKNNNQTLPTHVDTPGPNDTIMNVSPKRYEFILDNGKNIVSKPSDIRIVNGAMFIHEECFDCYEIEEIKVIYPKTTVIKEPGKRIHYKCLGVPQHPTAKITEGFE